MVGIHIFTLLNILRTHKIVCLACTEGKGETRNKQKEIERNETLEDKI
jgi:hypothetical protein